MKTKKFNALERVLQNIGVLKRSIDAPQNTSLVPVHKPDSWDKSREPMSEREFVRKFGSKVQHVRYSNKADFVGLIVYGKWQGFMVVRDDRGNRKIRLIDVDYDERNIHGSVRVTRR
jgi:hypothetical protein